LRLTVLKEEHQRKSKFEHLLKNESDHPIPKKCFL
jgi:hypothetical protein